ncbi:chaperonin 10-like protein [Panaeolus papilionaceus]|nr:chaperonin 10-like protein [Panaeolus papilionaceus]
MTPRTQKALILEEKFGNFVVKEISVYEPGPGEILINIRAVALNPVDWKVQKYAPPLITSYPAILGQDIAGDVEEVGDSVHDFKKGDRVFCQGRLTNSDQGFQQYTLGLAVTTAKIPDGVSYEEAATLPTALTTSYGGLYNASPHGLGLTPPTAPETENIYAGEALLVMNGSGSVGQAVIQFAKISGFSTIITTSSLTNSDDLQALGATHIIDRNLSMEAISTKIKETLGEQPLKFAYDAISLPETQKLAWDALAPGGQLELVALPSDGLADTDDKKFSVIRAILRAPHQKVLFENLYHDLVYGWLATGRIKANRVEVLPNGLYGILDGLKRLETGNVTRVKLVVRPQETP